MTGYSQSVEDYLETLYVIGLGQKVVRVKDVAHALGVTMPSVVAAVRTLSEKGLVEQEKYGHIELTEKGQAVAAEIYARHQMLFAFFSEILGLDPVVAEQDACRVEHHLSPEARERLLKMVEFVRSCENEKVRFLDRFIQFAETGERGSCRGCPLGEAPKE
jgi:DtxR family Mn-dependent transcriptional regulator